jgi:hypothetical protein
MTGGSKDERQDEFMRHVVSIVRLIGDALNHSISVDLQQRGMSMQSPAEGDEFDFVMRPGLVQQCISPSGICGNLFCDDLDCCRLAGMNDI